MSAHSLLYSYANIKVSYTSKYFLVLSLDCLYMQILR